jgi:hypothetical protein
MKEDIAQVEAVRRAVGDRMEIMVDANQAQTPGTPRLAEGPVWSYKRALATCRELEPLDIVWLEEPLSRFDFEHLARLSAATSVPLAGGENNVGLHEFRWLIDQNCYDVIQADVVCSEGLAQLKKVAGYAEMHHKTFVGHHGGSGVGIAAHLHLSASCPNSPYVELLQEPPSGRDHRLPRPDRRAILAGRQRRRAPARQARSRDRTGERWHAWREPSPSAIAQPRSDHPISAVTKLDLGLQRAASRVAKCPGPSNPQRFDGAGVGEGGHSGLSAATVGANPQRTSDVAALTANRPGEATATGRAPRSQPRVLRGSASCRVGTIAARRATLARNLDRACAEPER